MRDKGLYRMIDFMGKLQFGVMCALLFLFQVILALSRRSRLRSRLWARCRRELAF
jgi:hypothetical protein